ncbi:MAG: SOS response-associated peptidase family protein [Oscillospiraceae bacterium]|nr:SOS response-associated peptidase family protein [Oscillospiraceae bacterium]
MCCRFYMEMSEDLRPIVEAANRSQLGEKMVAKLGRPVKTQGEARPTDLVPVLAPNRAGKQTVFPMVWGFSLEGRTSPVINARVETAAQKPTFRESWQSRRCVIPASYYFEWEHLTNAAGQKKTGDKYMLQTYGSEMTWLAGLYRIETCRGLSYPVFTILTRAPGEKLRFIHDRMPLVLPREAVYDWIRPDGDPDEVAKQALTELEFGKTI